MAIRKISEALTHEANSQFALFSVSPRETQSCCFIFPPHYKTGASSASVLWSHLLLLLTLTTWGQYCHIERGGGGACNYLVKVKMKQLSVQGALNNPSAMLCQIITPEYQLTMTAVHYHLCVQLEKSTMGNICN